MGPEELRPSLRREQTPAGAVVVIRGGPNSLERLRRHALRTETYYKLDGQPLRGVSAFCALDAEGAASLDGLLSGRMVSYRDVHLPTAGALLDAGFELLPTFNRPHYTLRMVTVEDQELARLLNTLGPAERNPYYEKTRRQGGSRP